MQVKVGKVTGNFIEGLKRGTKAFKEAFDQD